MKTALAILVILTTATAASGPGGAQRKAAPKPAVQAAKSDSEIEKDIRARFARSKIDAEKFQVRVQGGVATIEGKTDVVQHKGVATRLAKSGGALAVVNRIQISEAAREKAAKNLETGRRRAQIRRGEARSEAAKWLRDRMAGTTCSSHEINSFPYIWRLHRGLVADGRSAGPAS